MIRHLHHHEINTEKWDNCIQLSPQGRVYACSSFLHAVAPQWEAYVLGDYESVMPLPVRRKMGIRYLFIPPFTQQLGVFSLSATSSDTVRDFIHLMQKEFRFADILLNSSNQYPGMQLRTNYLLDISSSYEENKAKYSRSAIRNIKKATDHGIKIREGISIEELIHTHRIRFRDRIGFGKADYEKLLQFCQHPNNQKMLFNVGAFNEKGNMIAGSLFILFKNRITFILNANNSESLENGSTHLLMDAAIRKFSQKNFIIDFEGSDVESFARFYEQYGAEKEMYGYYRHNTLPQPLRWIKDTIKF